MGVNHPGSLEGMVSNWEPACSLVEDAVSGPRLPGSFSGCCPPASLPLEGDGPVCWPLALFWYSLSPLFCDWAWQCLRLGLLVGNISLPLFLSLLLAIPQFGLLPHISYLRLPSGHSSLVLTLGNADSASLFSPSLLLHWQLLLGT